MKQVLTFPLLALASQMSASKEKTEFTALKHKQGIPMKMIIVFIYLLSFNVFAAEGHDTGGGGIGVPRGEEILLYDFVEAGIEDNVTFDPRVGDEMGALKIVKASIMVSADVQQIISDKLNEINNLSPTLGQILLSTIKNYQWRFILPNLRSTNDLGRTPVRTSLEKKQIANRDDVQKTVTIDRQYLALMPLAHQAGLFMHEIVYALAGTTDSYTSRIFNSYLFHPSFTFQTFSQLKERVALIYPRLTILDSITATTVVTPSFIKKCNDFKIRSSKMISAALAFQTKIVNSVYNKADSCYEPQDLRRSMKYVLYQGKDYLMNNYQFNLPTEFACLKEDIFSNLYRSVIYVIPKRDQNKIIEQRAQANVLLDTDEEEFLGQCLSSEDKSNLQIFSQMSVTITQ